MSHETVIMNGGESPLASKLKGKDRAAAPAYENQPSTAHGSPTMDGGAAPLPGQKADAPVASADPSGVASGGGIMRPRKK